jgi:hypothetical protein
MTANVPEFINVPSWSTGLQRDTLLTTEQIRNANIRKSEIEPEMGSNSKKTTEPCGVRSAISKGMHLPNVHRIGYSETDKENDAKGSK